MKKYLLILCLLTLPANAQVIDYAKDGFPPLVPQNYNQEKLADNSYNNLKYNKLLMWMIISLKFLKNLTRDIFFATMTEVFLFSG